MSAPADLSRARVLLGGVVLAAIAQYVVVEIIVAGAWRSPSYDWVQDFVSDLGRQVCLPESCSPRHTAFNVSLMVHGGLVLLGALLLAPLVGRAVGWVRALFVVTAVGNAMVGIFPLSQGSSPLHYTGASLAIGGGTVAIGLIGILSLTAPRRRPFGATTLVLAAVGVAGILGVLLGAPSGLTERIAIYPVIGWYVGLGLLLLVARPTRADT